MPWGVWVLGLGAWHFATQGFYPWQTTNDWPHSCRHTSIDMAIWHVRWEMVVGIPMARRHGWGLDEREDEMRGEWEGTRRNKTKWGGTRRDEGEQDETKGTRKWDRNETGEQDGNGMGKRDRAVHVVVLQYCVKCSSVCVIMPAPTSATWLYYNADVTMCRPITMLILQCAY